jgi:ABC-type amino acid transport substrate-binding protein
MTGAARSLFLALLLCAGTARALDLTVALVAQEPGDMPAAVAPGPGLAAVNADLAREICLRIGARCQLVYRPFGDILADVEAERVDLGFGNFLRTPERESRVALSDPVWRSSSRLLAKAATVDDFAARLGHAVTLATLRDARVVAIAGSQQGTYLERAAAGRGLTLIAAATPAEAVRELLDDRADFALLPVFAAYAQLSREPAQPLAFAGPAVVGHGLGGTVHVAMARRNDTLRQQVDRAIAAIRADGTYQRIVRRHLPFGLD